MKHSRQWLQLALDTQYHLLERNKRYVFPLNMLDHQRISTFQHNLKEIKTRKLRNLVLKQTGSTSKNATEAPIGFNNLSSQILDPTLTKILNKGPSFVNADSKQIPRTCLLARASLQAAVDKLEAQQLSTNTLNEFKGGIARIIDKCETSGTQILQSKRQTYQKPPDSVVITPTDKTKRLVAIDTTQYKDILHKSTIATGNYQPKLSKLNQPRTEQIKFNGI